MCIHTNLCYVWKPYWFQDKVNNQSPDYKLTKEIKMMMGALVYIFKTADSSKVTDYIVEGKVYEFCICSIDMFL